MARLRHLQALGAFAMVTFAPQMSAVPASVQDAFTNSMERDGVTTFALSASHLRALGSGIRGAVGAPAKGPWTEYTATAYCKFVPPGHADADLSCTAEWIRCGSARKGARPRGPAMWVWKRYVDAKGRVVDTAGRPIGGDGWEVIGYTCEPHLIPGATNVLTMEDVIRQFHNTVFAKPGVAVQPVGGTTLVNLPTYYELKWSATGFAPGDVDTTTLLGRQVRIRPTFKHALYIFGDGTTSGATASTGGPYPSGDVVHTYSTAATVKVRVDVTYGGEFSVDGGAWVDIPGEVTIHGAPFDLRVAEARARLYVN